MFVYWRSDPVRVWAELHEKAFRRLGGAPRVVVLDNLREGVLSPDFYDPAVNPLYRDVLAHYGVTALPCKVRDPDRKGKVESGVAHAQKTPLKGKKFESLEEAQAYLDHWEQNWADKRIHGRTKRQVAAMFAEEKPFLQTLPVEPFRYYQYGKRTVHIDGCVEVDAAYYFSRIWINLNDMIRLPNVSIYISLNKLQFVDITYRTVIIQNIYLRGHFKRFGIKEPDNTGAIAHN